MNKRGFITPLMVFGIMISTSLFLAVSYKSIAINNVRVKESDSNLSGLISVRTAYERIDGVFTSESITDGIVAFDDIDKSIEFEEVDRTDRQFTIQATVIDNVTKETYENMYKRVTFNIPDANKLESTRKSKEKYSTNE